MTSCPPKDILVALVDGRLSEPDAERLHRHMDACTACLTVLASVVGAERSGFLRALVPSLAADVSAAGARGSRASAPVTVARAPTSAASERAVASPSGLPLTDGPSPGSGEWRPPASFDDFQLIRLLGHGGMGRVYLAHDAVLDRLVAIKLVAAQSPDQRALDRFLLEARVIARLQHPNVVSIFRIGEVEGRPYLAYEFVDGSSLESIEKPVVWQSALAIALGLARGLAAAHKAGVLHRDIKPANAILASSGDVKLLDFGIAKLVDEARRMTLIPPELLRAPAPASLDSADPSFASADTALVRAPRDVALTDTHAVLGTPLYLAPEIWTGGAPSARADIYSFGLLLYELCAGELPNAGLDVLALARRAATYDVPPLRAAAPAVPEVLAAVIDRCVRRDPLARFGGAEELCEALESADAVCRAFQLVKATSYSGMMPIVDDASIVAQSFGRVSPKADVLVSRFYERVFEAAPSLRGLFPSDMTEQRQKLASALTLVVENARRPDILDPMLETLGRRHVAYGALPDHFDIVGAALLGAIEEIEGPGFTPAVAGAWSRTYEKIAALMKRGLQLAASEAASAALAASSVDAPRTPAPPSSGAASASDRVEIEESHAPITKYARSGDATIAYQVIGDGPIDVALVQEWVTHLELAWEQPAFARFLRGLASFSRLILYDTRGSGMSDRDAPGSIEERRDDLCAVLDAVGSSRAALVGVGAGAAAAAFMAATQPSRVSALVLYGGGARLSEEAGERGGEAYQEVRASWGSPLFIERDAPTMAGDAAFRKWWASYLRMGASPGGAVALLRAAAAVDVRGELPSIESPTLVLRRSGDRAASRALCREAADAIPGSRYLEIPGDDHAPFVGDVGAVIDEIRRFVLQSSSTAQAASAIIEVATTTIAPARSISTIISTDPREPRAPAGAAAAGAAAEAASPGSGSGAAAPGASAAAAPRHDKSR